MSADVIDFMLGRYGHRIRIPGPGEQFSEPAAVITLPVIASCSPLKPTPTRQPPRRTRRQLDDEDERRAEPIGPGEKESGPAQR